MELHSQINAGQNSNRVRVPVRVSWPPCADARLIKMHLDGLSLRAIASAFRLSRCAITRHARQIGLIVPSRPVAKQSAHNAASEMRDDGNREPLPAGHPISWDLLTLGTCMEGEPYVHPGRGHFRECGSHSPASSDRPSSQAVA